MNKAVTLMLLLVMIAWVGVCEGETELINYQGTWELKEAFINGGDMKPVFDEMNYSITIVIADTTVYTTNTNVYPEYTPTPCTFEDGILRCSDDGGEIKITYLADDDMLEFVYESMDNNAVLKFERSDGSSDALGTNNPKNESRSEWLYEGEDGIRFRFAKGLQIHYGYLELTLEVENGTDTSIGIIPVKVKINGWDVDAYCYDKISPKGKRRCSLQFKIEQAGITDYEEMDNIEMSFELYRSDTNMKLLEVGPYTITCSHNK